MKPKYTPGPWKVRFVGDEIWINSTHWEALAKVSSVPEIVEENTGENQGMDNARLIAAAPELLAAIKEIYSAAVDMHSQFLKHDGWRDDATEEVIQIVENQDRIFEEYRNLIAKAEGRG